jgi:reverse gyrase
LRIYAKNQEKIKRNKRLDQICFHKLMKRRYKKKFNNRQNKKNWLINKNDIIISTCVNSYNDDLINYKFPFVIIIDADNSNENENLIPITLNAKFVLFIAYEGYHNEDINLYKRMKSLYPENHCDI